MRARLKRWAERLVRWLEEAGFTRDEALHALGGLALAVWCLSAPWWWLALSVPLWVGYLREVAQAQATHRASPWNPLSWTNHRLREAAAWGVGGWVAAVGWGACAHL